MLIAQITDMHIVEAGTLLFGKVDTAGFLDRAVTYINGLEPAPDLILATGDLTDSGTAEAYQNLTALLAPLKAPCYLIPGNHDDRDVMRAAMPSHDYLPRQGFLQYQIDAGPLCLIALDTAVTGAAHGELCDRRLAWLDERLVASVGTPTIVFMHHPPFATGITHMDRMGLREGAEALGAILDRYHHVERVICGHLHRTIYRRWHGTVVSTMPSTAHQVGFNLQSDGRPGLNREPPCVQVHRWSADDGLVSHMTYIDSFDRP